MALEFDGDDHVDCGDEVDLSAFAGATIALWVRTGSDLNTEQRIFAKHNNNYGNGYWMDIYDGSFRARVYVEGQSSSTLSAPVAPNEWFHLALVHDGQMTRFYRNGVLEAEAAAQGQIHENDYTIFLGASKNGAGNPVHFFTGLIDEVTIYDVALPGPDVQAVYEGGL